MGSESQFQEKMALNLLTSTEKYDCSTSRTEMLRWTIHENFNEELLYCVATYTATKSQI